MKQINFRAQKAQSTLEFAVLIVCVAAALIAMQIYVKRGLSGRFRQIADDIGPQYEPRQTTGVLIQSISRNVDGKVETIQFKDPDNPNKEKTGLIKKETINKETTEEWGDETVGPMG